jgi:MtrB/PioB family decaheme-associated outer membrane protein
MNHCLVVALLWAAPAWAGQAPASDAEAAPTNEISVGARATNVDGDAARLQHYRDLRNGPTADLLKYNKSTDHWRVDLQSDHAGYRDQRYTGSLNVYGKLKVAGEWDQVPLFFSEDTATPYVQTSPGVLRLDDALQSGVQSGGLTLADVAAQARPFDLRFRRDTGSVKLTYEATRDLDLNFSFKNTHKNGEQPWGATFGFSNDVEVPVPVDHRTTELATSAEWSHGRGLLSVGYDGSFFRNNIQTLVWDNPLVAVDSTSGSSSGRMALWPDSDLNAGHVTGSIGLPARSRATAYVSVGNWSQNAPLIPFTINSALPTIPLDRSTADVKAIVTAMNYSFTTRPSNDWWFSARYRRYDFDNRTPVFHVDQTVTYDQTVTTFPEVGTTPFGYVRNTYDADASYTPTALPHTAFRLGYTRENVDRSFRVFESTAEDTIRASADTTRWSWLTVRGVYEHAKRSGAGLDEQVLDDIGEQVSLRQFDISDKTSDRLSTIVQLLPESPVSFSFSGAVGREDRPNTVFGLRSNDNYSASAGVDYVPRDAISLGAEYEYEHYSTLQASRQANPPPSPQFTDPTRDWTTDAADVAHTISASADLLQLAPKTDVRFAYDYSHAKSTYVYGLAPNSTLGPIQQLPPVVNGLMRATTDVQYHWTTHLAVGAAYWFDRYRVQDFALSPDTLDQLNQPSFLILGYVYRPYTANTVWGRVSYLW